MGKKQEDFFVEVSRFADTLPATAEKFWDCFAEVIIRRMYIEGQLYLPKIGMLTTKVVNEQRQIHRNPNTGELVEYTAPAHEYPVFKPEDGFIDDINGFGVGKRYRYREKNNQLTLRDIERKERLEAMQNQRVGEKDILNLEEAYQQRFKELLAEKHKKEKKNGKNKK